MNQISPSNQMVEAILARIADRTNVHITGHVMPVQTFQRLRDAIAAIKEDAAILDGLLNDLQAVVFGQEQADARAAAWIAEVSGWASDCGHSVACESVVGTDKAV